MDAGANGSSNARGEFSHSATPAVGRRRTSRKNVFREDANLLVDNIDGQAGSRRSGLDESTADGKDPNQTTPESESSHGGEDAGNEDVELGPEDDIYMRRHEIESDGSVFEPSDGERDNEKHHLSGDNELEGDDTENVWSPRKRSFGSAFPEDGSLKRVKGRLRTKYLALLNDDILDAVAQYLPTAKTELGNSQIGLTVWTSEEKDLFFSSVSRLGVDDASAIAARIGTKGEFEVAQYLALLQDGREARMKAHNLDEVQMSDHASAVELSQACCDALDEAADIVSLRQEKYEESREEQKWGDDWLITWCTYKDIQGAKNVRSAAFFNMRNWLLLSQRIFMNAAFPEGNWQVVAEETPSIRATALEDFHALVVSVTRRLFAAAIYTAESRIRSQQNLDNRHQIARFVKPHDVQMAAMSVGLKVDSKEFWAKCPRRLRLDVVDDDASLTEEEEHLEPMSYQEVETRLGVTAAELAFASDGESSSGEDTSDTSSSTEENSNHDQGSPAPSDDDEAQDIQREVDELCRYTLLEYSLTRAQRQGLAARIASARKHEAYAAALDTRAAHREEKRLWGILGRDPPKGLAEVDMPQAPKPLYKFHGDDALALYHGDWRDHVKYVNEWDMEMEDDRRGREAARREEREPSE